MGRVVQRTYEQQVRQRKQSRSEDDSLKELRDSGVSLIEQADTAALHRLRVRPYRIRVAL